MLLEVSLNRLCQGIRSETNLSLFSNLQTSNENKLKKKTEKILHNRGIEN